MESCRSDCTEKSTVAFFMLFSHPLTRQQVSH
nr:MAG TPA: hypothetical protein [Caudoviricetes sp.]